MPASQGGKTPNVEKKKKIEKRTEDREKPLHLKKQWKDGRERGGRGGKCAVVCEGKRQKKGGLGWVITKRKPL